MEFARDTLYVSDLDGTLLGAEPRLPEEAVPLLNEMLDAGLPFTVATARSWTSAEPIVRLLHLKHPVVAYNGAFLVDPVTGRDIDRCLFDAQQMQRVARVFLDAGLSPMVYAQIDGRQKVSWLKSLESEGIREYARDRAGDPRLRPVETMEALFQGEVFYLSSFARRETLLPLEPKARALDFAHTSFTSDAYKPDWYWLEISRFDATKATGVDKLRKLTGIPRIVCFGDNLNDLPMFRVADECYAVANARPELKAAATGVIGSNVEMGVPRFLRSRAR